MAYESQHLRCPVCGDSDIRPSQYSQSWDNSCAHWCADQPLPGDEPRWSHRISFQCKSGCYFSLVIEQLEAGTIMYTSDHIMTWSPEEFT